MLKFNCSLLWVRQLAALFCLGASSTLCGAGELLEWERSDNALALMRGKQPVWRFALDDLYHRPHFHPLTFPDGRTFTEIHQPDHPWHFGLWFQPKKVNGLEYWQSGWRTVGKEYMPPGEALEKGQMGLVEVRGVELTPHEDFGATIRTETVYAPRRGAPPILREDRIATVSPPAPDGGYWIDLNIEITALADIVFERWPYGGFALRTIKNEIKREAIGDLPDEAFLGSNAETPTRSRYLAVVCQFKDDGYRGTAMLMDHPDNINFPTAWVANHWMPCAALTALGDIRLGQDQTLKLRYRLQVFGGVPSKSERDEAWQAFASNRF